MSRSSPCSPAVPRVDGRLEPLLARNGHGALPVLRAAPAEAERLLG